MSAANLGFQQSPPETPPSNQPPAKKLTRLEALAVSLLSIGISLAYAGIGIEEGVVWRDIFLTIANLGLLSGIILFILSGIQRIQQKQGTNLPRAALHVIKKVTLYLLLPSVIICAGIIVWATMTGRFPVR